MKFCFNCFREMKDGDSVCGYCGCEYNPEPKEPIQLMPGTVLKNRYFIGRAVGAGGFGIVYKAFDQKLQRIVAVKEFFLTRLMTRAVGEKEVIIFQSKNQKAEFLYRKGRFLAEARTMAKFISNDNIPDVYSFFEENGNAYIVMELLEGVTLKEYMESKNGKVDTDFALMVISQVANALKALHEKKIYHLDVAPDNIFICGHKDIKVVLMDLGAAKLANGDEEVSDKILKPGYSPEELYNDLKNIGPWSDIYSLGATLYHMLTGIKPSESTNRKIEDVVVAPHELNPKIPVRLSNTIMRAMAIEKHLRFQSADSFLNAISGKKKIRSPKAEKRFRKLMRALSVVAALCVLAGSGWFTYNYYNEQSDELADANITVWYCADESSAERRAMDAIKADFESTFTNVQVQVSAFTPEEYAKKLEEAGNSGKLPTLFESTDIDPTVLAKATDVSAYMGEMSFDDALFLKDYEKSGYSQKQLPIAIDIPVACVITDGITSYDYKDKYFKDISDLGDTSNISIATDYRRIVEKNFTGNFLSESNFLDEKNNTSAVMLTSTRDINRILESIPGYTKSFVYYKGDNVQCDYTYFWSVGTGSQNEQDAAVKLLEWMLKEKYQAYLMISYNNEGQIPVDKNCFNQKMSSNSNLEAAADIKDKFVFNN